MVEDNSFLRRLIVLALAEFLLFRDSFDEYILESKLDLLFVGWRKHLLVVSGVFVKVMHL
jgi:hypothetical protein